MALLTLAAVKAALQPPIIFQKPGASNAANGGGWNSGWGSNNLANPTVTNRGPFTEGSFDTTLNGVTLTAPVTGSVPWSDAPSGSAYLARCQIHSLSSGNFPGYGLAYLCDRLWHNGGIDPTLTTAQTIVSPTWPARDENGATSGEGVLLCLEVNTANASSVASTVSISYTNSQGTAGRTASPLKTFNWNSTARAAFPIALQGGDTGVQSVQSITFGTGTAAAGAIVNLVAFRPLACVHVFPQQALVFDAVTLPLAKILPSPVLFFYGLSNNGNAGSINFFVQLTPAFG